MVRQGAVVLIGVARINFQIAGGREWLKRLDWSAAVFGGSARE
jgi:hypothetical protein